MAEEKVEIVLDGKDAGIVRAWMATKASIEATEAALGKIDPVQKRNAESARQFQRDVKSAIESTLTPLEQYEAKLQHLNELYTKSGGVSSEVYNRRKAQLQAELAQADGSAAQRASAERELAASLSRQEVLERQHAARSLATQKQKALEQEKLEQQQAAGSFAKQKKMFLEGQQLTDQAATSQERYNQRLATLKRHLDAGTISQQTYARSVKQSKEELNSHGTILDSTKGQVAGIVGSWVSVQAAISLATNYVEEFRESNRNAQEESQVSARNKENRTKQFQVVAGLTDEVGKAAQSDLDTIAQETGTPNEQVNDIAKMIVSSGGTVDAGRGGGTKSIAEFIKAQALKGTQVNAEQFTDSITSYILSQDKEINATNISELVKKLQSKGVKSTKFKITDLGDLAEIGADLKEFGLTEDEQIAQFTLLSNVYKKETKTKMRSMIENLKTIGGKPDAQPWLKKMKMKSEDIDMVDEDFPTAMKRLMAGLERLPEKDRAPALKKIVEGANYGVTFKTANQLEKAEQVKKGLSDTTEYESDVKTMTTGREVADIRAKNKAENIAADRGDYGDVYRKGIENTEEAGFFKNQRLGWYDYYRSLGESPEASTQRSYMNSFAKTRQGNDASQMENFRVIEAEVAKNLGGREVLDELKAMRKSLEAAAAGKTQVEVKVNGTVAPSKVQAPAPRPAAALSFEGGSDFGGSSF